MDNSVHRAKARTKRMMVSQMEIAEFFLGPRAALSELRNSARWIMSGYAAPAPRRVKLKVLERYGNPHGHWIESGTYLGQTTRALARRAASVITIEPSDFLAKRAARRLRRFDNVRVVHSLSEDVISELVNESSSPLSVWLDGHTSGGWTFHGPSVTPIRAELDAIAEHSDHLTSLAVFIDDLRGFGQSHQSPGAYPRRSELVSWADQLHLSWTVEHDIFIAWR